MWAIILSGVPGSGKTFFRKRLMDMLDTRVMAMYDTFNEEHETLLSEHELSKVRYLSHFENVAISSDDVIDRLAHRLNTTYADAHNAYYFHAKELFWQKFMHAIYSRSEVIILDRTFINETHRMPVVNTLRTAAPDYKIMSVNFATPPDDEWQERLDSREGKIIPESVLTSMLRNHTSPKNDVEVKYDRTIEMINPENQCEIVKSICDMILDVPELR